MEHVACMLETRNSYSSGLENLLRRFQFKILGVHESKRLYMNLIKLINFQFSQNALLHTNISLSQTLIVSSTNVCYRAVNIIVDGASFNNLL